MSIITDIESSVYLFVSVCTCTLLHVWVWCAVCPWRPEVDVRCLPESGACCLAFEDYFDTSSYSPVLGSRCVLCCWFNVLLTLVLWIQLRSWCHHKKNFFSWVISSALIFLILEREKNLIIIWQIRVNIFLLCLLILHQCYYQDLFYAPVELLSLNHCFESHWMGQKKPR